MQLIKALIELIKSLFTRKKKVNRDVIVDLYKIPEGIDLNNKADREVLANQLCKYWRWHSFSNCLPFSCPCSIRPWWTMS